MKTREELLFSVIENFMLHSTKQKSDNPVIRELANQMCDVDIWEMWVLTQK